MEQVLLCPSPTVPNLLPNEHEWTIRVGSGVHSWSFQSIPIHSSSVLLMCVGSAGEYKSFEHVQKLRVASTNEFHSCLCLLITCSYRVCLTEYVLYSSHSHCIRTVFWLFLLYTRSFIHVGGTGADMNGPEHSTNRDGMCQRLMQSTYSCSYSCSYSC